MSESTSTATCACGAKPAAACAAEKSTPKETKAAAKPAVIQNGKGDAPRNISQKFRSNYEGIKWSSGGKLKKGERLVKVYA